MDRSVAKLRKALDTLYERYNRREFVHPDPLEFLYEYDEPADREIVGLLAASLAYGRVAQILRNIRQLLEPMGPSPRRFLVRASPAELHETLATFKHRWTTGREVAELLAGMRRALEQHGSLQRAFVSGLGGQDETVQQAVERFVEQLRAGSVLSRSSLLPVVQAGGACKRVHLFLRWMVRRDAVDPGGWQEVPPAKLIVPLDTHMHRIGAALGMCSRKPADLLTALAITAAFREIQPEDPVRYDFTLTRFGIRAELDEREFLSRCKSLACNT